MQLQLEQFQRVVKLECSSDTDTPSYPSMTGLSEFISLLQSLDTQADIGCILLRGFESQLFAEHSDTIDPHCYLQHYNLAFNTLASLSTPTLVAVQRQALGWDCELAMAADIVIATDKSYLAVPDISRGLPLSEDSTRRLTQLVGRSKAMEMILTGRKIPAAEAQAIGLVTRVVSSDELLPEAMSTAELIASHEKGANTLAKARVRNRSQHFPSEQKRYRH